MDGMNVVDGIVDFVLNHGSAVICTGVHGCQPCACDPRQCQPATYVTV